MPGAFRLQSKLSLKIDRKAKRLSTNFHQLSSFGQPLPESSISLESEGDLVAFRTPVAEKARSEKNFKAERLQKALKNQSLLPSRFFGRDSSAE
jgi:hypothetical protein